MTENMNPSSTLITRLSPAKINLFLHITGKRADGYHDLQTVFRLLDWGDYIHFLPSTWLTLGNQTELTTTIQRATMLCSQLVTLAGADNITGDLTENLIIKAATTLLINTIELQRLPIQLQQVHITLDKCLPMGAGLGGGSSNAATTLMVLNEVWQLGLSDAKLRAIGATIGSDVPIFIFGQDAIAMGIGDQFTAIDLPNQQYLILTPNVHINTAQLFAHSMLRRDVSKLAAETISHQPEHYTQTLHAPYHNVFTPVVESIASCVAEALKYLHDLETQALGTARMTGSGSAVFLPLDDSLTDNKELLANWIKNAPCPAYIANNL